MYQSSLFNNIAGISHGFGRAGVPIEEHVPDGVIIHRAHQVHGNTVHVLDDKLMGTDPIRGLSPYLNGDAFITTEVGVVCFVRTADCVPILIADPVKGVIGAVHAGWRGAKLDVAGATIRKMRDAFGSDPAKLYAAIGPSICGDCYDVDLRFIVRGQLTRTGVPKKNIDSLNLCTTCSDADLASYRRDMTDIRQVNFILLNA